MKICEYTYKEGMYQTACGSKFIFRPKQKCDKCGKKPQEKK
jgi:hypothetical protein